MNAITYGIKNTTDNNFCCLTCLGKGYSLTPSLSWISPKRTEFILEKCHCNNKLDWTIYEEIGVVIVNDYNTSKIELE